MMKSYLFIIAILTPLLSFSQSTERNLKGSSKPNSVLSSGKWVKIGVNQTGIHKIPYSLLQEWGFSNPSKVNIFGNGGHMLAKATAEDRFFDLEENSTMHDNNAIYFFALGTTKWEYDYGDEMFIHQQHDYTSVAYYFLSDSNGEGRKVETIPSNPNYNVETNEYDSYSFHDNNATNIMKSGRTWYGEHFSKSKNSINLNFNFPNLIESEPIKIMTNVIGRSNASSYFDVFTNSSETPTQHIFIGIIKKLEEYGGSYAIENTSIDSFYGYKGDNNISLKYSAPNSESEGWLNYVCLNTKQTITVGNNSQLSIRNIDITKEGNVTYFNTSDSNSYIWDVSKHTAPIQISPLAQGFSTETDTLKEFVIFKPDGNLLIPFFVENVSIQNLKGMEVPEMLIITHPDFIDQANELAKLHKDKSNLESKIVFPQTIYNEFSSGQPDITAIRDFNKYLFDQDAGFKYLLLFGDGSYNNTADSPHKRLLTFQSANSIAYNSSYTSDDFFGILGDNVGKNITHEKIDIGIGRLPASTTEEAQTLVDKIKDYINNQEAGKWKSQITLLADDEDGNRHTRAAEAHADTINNYFPDYEINKIYFDAYTQEKNSSGERYPQVNDAIKKALEDDGTLIFNYTGHGNTTSLGHEYVVTMNDINKWTNKNKLALFVTATCEFSRYDDDETSAGELITLTPHGGGIALFTTTRIAFSDSNAKINDQLFKCIFEKDENGDKLRLGEIAKRTKNNAPNGANTRQFTLLGDPALQLNYPNSQVLTKSINKIETPEKRDTISAMSLNNIKGFIPSANESLFKNGTAEITIYDKRSEINTLGNNDEPTFQYSSQESIIFKGKTAITNGEFSVDFIVPKDIKYNYGVGRISYFATDENNNEAFGSDTFMVGGITDNPPHDNTGPTIDLWANNQFFSNGLTVNNKPILEIQLKDENGINASGSGIGHDIILTIDGDNANSINLNHEYRSLEGSYQKGVIDYQLKSLEPGFHTLELKAWDNLNNSSTVSYNFNIDIPEELEIFKVSVEPNPISLSMNNGFTMVFDHQAPNTDLTITSSIYTINGQIVDQRTDQVPSDGTTSIPINWKPRTSLSQGLYLIKYKIVTEDGQVAFITKKIIVIQ